MAAFDDVAVDGNRETTALQEMNKCVAFTGDPFALLDGFGGRDDLGGCRYANAERQPHGAGTQAVLLPTTTDQWLDPILQITANVQSSNAHRLMIFSQWTKKLAETAPNRLITEIQNFRLTQPADRYLFAVWHNEGTEFEFCVYVHA